MVTDEHSLNSCVSSHHWDRALELCVRAHTHTQSYGERWCFKVKNKETGWQLSWCHTSVSNMLLSPLNISGVCAQEKLMEDAVGTTWVKPESSEFHMTFKGGWRKWAVFSSNLLFTSLQKLTDTHHLKTTTTNVLLHGQFKMTATTKITNIMIFRHILWLKHWAWSTCHCGIPDIL